MRPAPVRVPVRPGRSDDELVIGEAVLLELRPASFGARVAARLIDVFAQFATLLVLSIPVTAVSELLDGAAQDALDLATTVFVLVALPAIVETMTRGRSPGKWAVGLRVVRDDGGPIRIRQAVIRALVGIGELWLLFGMIAALTAATSRRGKRLGDMLAGTYVMKERVQTPRPAPIEMPPGLAGWARGADIRRLPDGLALQVRLFLHRAPRMRAEIREWMGAMLAHQVGELVAPAPPHRTPPEPFLAAVLAERRSRELARLHREQQAAQVRHAVLHRLPHTGLPAPPS